MDFFRKLLFVLAVVGVVLIVVGSSNIFLGEEPDVAPTLASGDYSGFLLARGRALMSVLGFLLLFGAGAYWFLLGSQKPIDKGQLPVRPPEEKAPPADFSVVTLEVVLGQMLGGGDGIPFGEGTPPGFTVKALAQAKERWFAVGARCDERTDYDTALETFQHAAAVVGGAVPVHGDGTGEAASYRLALMVGTRGLPTEDPEALLQALGKLSGDRILELKTTRVPAKTNQFAPSMTVTGELAAVGLIAG